MPDRVQNILNRIKEWWTKFSAKQKTLVVSIAGIVAIALGILAFVMNQPNMVSLIVCENATEASEVKKLLEDEGISADISSDGLTFSVDKKDESEASILLGSNGIPTEGYSIDNVFEEKV